MPSDSHDWPSLNRRRFVQASLLPAAISADKVLANSPFPNQATTIQAPSPPKIIDTNVHLFDWPFRKLKYSKTESLITKLRRHGITQAWAGSFEAVLHKQLDAVNRRLAEECRTRGDGLLLPIGSVNPAWPDWEEDLRRCHEEHGMRGLRLYPAYHGYALDHPEFARLLNAATDRGLLVQIALRMEDERVHHPAIDISALKTSMLVPILRQIPRARVQLINSAGPLLGRSAAELVDETQVTFDIAATEGNGGVGRLIEGSNPSYRCSIPVERLMFGSHAPFFPCESAVMKLFESPLNREQLEKLMNANALRLIS